MVVSKTTYKATYQQAEGVKFAEVPHGLVVYSREDDLHYLNHTAGAAFLLCAKPMTALDVARVLAEEFQLEDIPLHEIEKCLSDLVDKKMVVVSLPKRRSPV